MFRFLIVLMMCAGAGVAAADDKPRLFSVSGTGSVSRAPDMATISVGVTTLSQGASQGLDENSRDVRGVIDQLLAGGVIETDIQTSNFSIQPVYKSNKSYSSDDGPKVDHYRVSNMVTAIIRDVTKVGAVLDQVVSAGGNQVNGIKFGLIDRQSAEDEARQLAVADARRKAELIAAAAGVQLGPVQSISEGGGHVAPRAEMMVARAASVPIQGGELGITANVNITWRIGD